jgi:hypothetical protein
MSELKTSCAPAVGTAPTGNETIQNFSARWSPTVVSAEDGGRAERKMPAFTSR